MVNEIKVTITNGKSGKYGHAGFVNVVELAPETTFRSVRDKNVVAVHSRVPVDLRCTGPRSRCGRAVAAAEKLAANLAAKLAA